MLNRLIAILIMVSLTTVNCSRFFVYAGFELNKEYIVTKLCENRTKPWMHCNGRCYLMKKLRQATEKQATEAQQAQKDLFQEVYLISSTAVRFHNQLLQVITTPYQSSQTTAPAATPFRPPQLA